VQKVHKSSSEACRLKGRCMAMKGMGISTSETFRSNKTRSTLEYSFFRCSKSSVLRTRRYDVNEYGTNGQLQMQM